MIEVKRVEGLTELRDMLLRKLPEATQGKALQGALREAAKPIVKEARARVPVKTGRLRKAIYSFRDRASRRTREVRLISVRSGKRFQKANKDAYYWKWIEFGHGVITLKHRRQGGKGKVSKSLGTPAKGFFGKEVQAAPARPFMRSAFETRKYQALEAFRQTLAAQIDKVAARNLSRVRSRLSRKLGF